MVELQDIEVAFSGKKLFENLNLQLNNGEFVMLVGDNGAGKSTLLNLIAGTVKPQKGRILFDGEDVTKLSTHQRAKYIGRVFQDPKLGTCSDMTVLENISLYLNKGMNYNLKRGITRQKDFDLEFPLSQVVNSLSGGQRQVLSLKMATFNEPRILLLDEHTAALDPAMSEQVMSETNELVRKYPDMLTIMITHNLKMTFEYGNRLLFFKNGEIVLDSRDKLSMERLVEMYA